MGDYEYAETLAAKMLSEGLRTAAAERGLSVRQIGKLLEYKQAVVLSHMANGRVPIPIDRALDIAREVGLPGKQFLEAVLRQRHPDVDWRLITATDEPFVEELETIANKPLGDLSADHQRVLRDAVRDPDPQARWLSVPEIAAVQLLRRIFPNMHREGLSAEERHLLDLLPALRDAD
jgi:hypothetical protein